MRGFVAHDTDVLGRLGQARAHELIPETVHGDAGRHRVAAIDQPAGEVEAVGSLTFDFQGGQYAGRSGWNGLGRLRVFAADQELGGGRRGVLLHDERHGTATFNHVELGRGSLDFGHDGLVGLIDATVVVATQQGHGGGRSLRAFLADGGTEFGDLAQGSDVPGFNQGRDDIGGN